MNVCIICFSLNEPSNPLLYYFYIVFVCTFFLFNFKCSQSTKWTNIWKNLTPLDSSQLEVFLGISIFFKFKFKFKFWAGLKPPQTGNGPDRFDRLPWYPDRLRSVNLTLIPARWWVRVPVHTLMAYHDPIYRTVLISFFYFFVKMLQMMILEKLWRTIIGCYTSS